MNSGSINKLQAYDYNNRYSYSSDMAIANFTENGRKMKYEELFCIPDLNGDVHNRLTSLAVSAVNILVCYCISGEYSDPSRPSQRFNFYFWPPKVEYLNFRLWSRKFP